MEMFTADEVAAILCLWRADGNAVLAGSYFKNQGGTPERFLAAIAGLQAKRNLVLRNYSDNTLQKAALVRSLLEGRAR